ncbi:hypothetical protein COV24_03960 [candidate division WWE3 bacterium CG10_big_fil_rev_8_21_14_0_10_32_10]|uniref:HTH cro/C1-type domain-containing protein n=1 Tax=candidate division WWE3 bacterium CG10_big_fil_rev_8_21_14_0_10_32_10 TaxID=1975090 RepID=A0A2H0R9G5_UNCKA|nr:MAG: hypothetical protein COV24_03960 [candidate division WWE3 bacterium CG10_big_fil_rev_8_21_14_0_10_32_10]
MKTSGDILYTKREKMGFDLAQVSRKLKIHEKYLHALEEGDYTVFDSKVIARGFLIKYSDFLDLDTDKVLAFWRRDFAVETKSVPYSKNKFSSTVFTPKTILGIVLASFLIIFLVFGYIQYSKIKEPPYLNINSPEDGISVDDGIVFLKGDTSEDVELSLNDREIKVSNTGEFSENLYLSPGVNKFTLRAINSFGVENTRTFTVYNNFTKADQIGNKESKNILKVVATGEEPVFIEVKNKETSLFKGFLLSKATKTFNGDNLSIYTDTVEFVDLFYNDTLVDKGETAFGVFVKQF